jgi:hypothetical protein
MGGADLRLTAVLEIFEGRRREACNWGIEREAGFYAHDLQTLNKLLRVISFLVLTTALVIVSGPFHRY